MTDNIFGGQPLSFEIQAAAVAPVASPANEKRTWLDRQHPVYTRMQDRWRLVSDFYTGDVVDPTIATRYLVKRYQGEAQQAYDERLKVSDFTPHLGTLVDTLAGMFFAVEDNASRVWVNEDGQSALGDPNDKDTLAAALKTSADGKNTAWSTLWRQFTLDIICYQYMWVLVDVIDERPVVQLVRPQRCPDWIDGTNGPTEVLMLEHQDQRATLTADGADGKKPTWIRWTTTGWERWTKDEQQQPQRLETGTYRYVDNAGRPTLPIFRVELPMRRYVTWLLANKAQVLYNQESVRDFGVRVAGFAKLILGVAAPDQLEKLEQRLLQGQNVIPEDKEAGGAHRFITPPSEPTTNASEVLRSKTEEFWLSGFKMYADAAREKTATEIKQDVASGVGAFLQLLKAAVDDAENGALWRLEQAERSESPELWGICRVERSDDFSSVDMSTVLDDMRKRYLGEQEVIPIGRSGLIQLAKDAAKVDGLPYSDKEIENAVDVMQLNKLLTNLQLLNVTPALIKARLAMRLVTAMGLIGAEDTIEMSDGEQQRLYDVMMKQAEELAQVQEETQRRMAELPPFEGGGPSKIPSGPPAEPPVE